MPEPTLALLARGNCLDLCFDGLDTFVTIWVNGGKCHQSDNGYMSYRINLAQERVSCDGHLEIVILFDSAFEKGKELE